MKMKMPPDKADSTKSTAEIESNKDKNRRNKDGTSGRPGSGWTVECGRKRRTRTGCLTCRRRRVKCPEEKPVCSKCRKYGAICVYSDEGIGYLNSPPRYNIYELSNSGSSWHSQYSSLKSSPASILPSKFEGRGRPLESEMKHQDPNLRHKDAKYYPYYLPQNMMSDHPNNHHSYYSSNANTESHGQHQLPYTQPYYYNSAYNQPTVYHSQYTETHKNTPESSGYYNQLAQKSTYVDNRSKSAGSFPILPMPSAAAAAGSAINNSRSTSYTGRSNAWTPSYQTNKNAYQNMYGSTYTYPPSSEVPQISEGLHKYSESKASTANVYKDNMRSKAPLPEHMIRALNSHPTLGKSRRLLKHSVSNEDGKAKDIDATQLSDGYLSDESSAKRRHISVSDLVNI